MAAKMSDPADRERLLKTAQTFLQLADEGEGAGANPSDKRSPPRAHNDETA
jgi:hypothetical protein